MIGVAFKYLEIVVDRKAEIWKRLSKEEKFSIELTVTTNDFHSGIKRPNLQSSTALKFLKLKYQRQERYLFFKNTEVWHKAKEGWRRLVLNRSYS